MPLAATTRLVWSKRQFRCVESSCRRGSWVERHDAVGARQRTTLRLRLAIICAVAAGRAVAEIARQVGVSWRAAWRVVGVLAAEEGDELWPVTRLGIDETRSKGRHTWFVTDLVDLDRGVIVRSIPGRNKAVVVAALETMPDWWRTGIRIVALDAYAPYAAALCEALPTATQVVDKFHVVRLLAQALDQVRRRTCQQTNSRRGRRQDQLWTGRRVLLRRVDHAEGRR